MRLCSVYVSSRAVEYLRNIFYPVLDQVQALGAYLQYLVLGTSAFTNLSRDQEAFLQFIEIEIHSLEDLWNNNLLVLLGWEERRYDDEMIRHRSELTECLDFVENVYKAAAAEVIAALNICAVPTQHQKPSQLKPGQMKPIV
jgi:hypothetical protein